MYKCISKWHVSLVSVIMKHFRVSCFPGNGSHDNRGLLQGWHRMGINYLVLFTPLVSVHSKLPTTQAYTTYLSVSYLSTYDKCNHWVLRHLTRSVKLKPWPGGPKSHLRQPVIVSPNSSKWSIQWLLPFVTNPLHWEIHTNPHLPYLSMATHLHYLH